MNANDTDIEATPCLIRVIRANPWLICFHFRRRALPFSKKWANSFPGSHAVLITGRSSTCAVSRSASLLEIREAREAAAGPIGSQGRRLPKGLDQLAIYQIFKERIGGRNT